MGDPDKQIEVTRTYLQLTRRDELNPARVDDSRAQTNQAVSCPAGYFELERHSDGSTEIAYFGLIQEFLGRGLGKHLLTEAVERAWSEGANRVWLHTCTLDDSAALPNYVKRGFQTFKEEKYFATISFEEELRGKWRKAL